MTAARQLWRLINRKRTDFADAAADEWRRRRVAPLGNRISRANHFAFLLIEVIIAVVVVAVVVFVV